MTGLDLRSFQATKCFTFFTQGLQASSDDIQIFPSKFRFCFISVAHWLAERRPDARS